ncbi:response regulator [Candidatus Altiarchaeota archaeon]
MKKRILVVDDEPTVLQMMEKIVGSAYDVQSVDSADEAMDALKEADFDLILLDVMMPGMRPVDLIHWVKKNKTENPPRVVLVTALSFAQEEKDRMKDEGLIEGFIAKPFESSELLNLIKQTIEE